MSTLAATNLKHASSASNNIVLDSSGRALVGLSSANANGGILQLSSGITFPATQVLSSDPNTLDDYEEGTWTPVVNGWTSITYNTQEGNYVKIGRQITAWFFLYFSGTSAASAVFLDGLPFAVSSNHTGGALTFYNVFVNETTGILVYPSATQVNFYADNDSGATISSNGNVTNRYIIGSVTYAS